MSERKNNRSRLREDIIGLLKTSKQASLAPARILELLALTSRDRAVLLDEVKAMQEEGLVVKTDRGRYGLPDRLGLYTGTIDANRRGFAFLRPDSPVDDIYINARNLNNAAHGDRVVVRIDDRRSRRRREGTVIGILKRGQRKLVGILYREKKRYHVIPDDSRFPGPIQVASKDLKRAQPGDKVVVEIQKWAQGNRSARGAVVEHLGQAGSLQAERLTFKHRFELPGDFPPAVIKALESLPEEEMIEQAGQEPGRADLRDIQMVTIDDEQARDFDDAVSLEKLSGGGYRLGVHIADVSYYVRQGRAIDREALKRGTSIYLVDRVIHMLPPKLSENLCSLQAERNRLALSAVMDIDANGELVSSRLTPSLIRVTERLTYQQVEAYLNGDSHFRPFREKSLSLLVDNMVELAGILRKRRMERGALDLDLPEARIEVDEEGTPLSVEKRSMGRSESLIEEFMIYCNETVAQYLFKRKLPCVYRVHTLPTEEKLAQLRETLSLMGIRALGKTKVLKPKHLRRLIEETRGEKVEKLVRYLVLRSLPQAQYSANNEGHFGLASGCYCHFTSPIRRYPDLVVHRILKEQLAGGGMTGEKVKNLQTRLPDIARHCSERERAAVEAERASIEMKKAQFMENKIGEVYSGIINGVMGFGIFVELDNTIEGMIPVSELHDDYYIYNEKSASLVGERTRKTFRLGDEITIRVIRASREEGKITFAPEDGH